MSNDKGSDGTISLESVMKWIHGFLLDACDSLGDLPSDLADSPALMRYRELRDRSPERFLGLPEP